MVESLLSVSHFRVAKKRENASNLRKALRKRLLRRLWTVQHVLFVNVMTVQRCTPLSYDHDQCYNLRQNYLRQIENTPVFSIVFIKPFTLLHKYLSSPLPSFNVVLKTTGFVWASMMPKTTLYGGGEGGQFVQDSRCPIMALILENRRICLKSFVRSCS